MSATTPDTGHPAREVSTGAASSATASTASPPRRLGLALAVIATAGTTLTGAIDPLDELADICAEHGVWMHVDGAYGAPAASVLPDRFRGMERADSLTVDPHAHEPRLAQHP